MKTWFDSSVYEGRIPSTKYLKTTAQPPSYAMTLYDAIMVYAITVNDTLSKGQDYKDGAFLPVKIFSVPLAGLQKVGTAGYFRLD